MSWSDLAIAAVAVAYLHSLWWHLMLTRRLSHIERYLPARAELGQAAEAACRKAHQQGGDRAFATSSADAATWPPLISRGASGTLTSDCTPEPIDVEVSARVALTQAWQVNRLVAEVTWP